MKHSYFEITNFKGIEHIRLDFEEKPSANIYTLVGLNESGKTTILEAIHFFESNVLEVESLGHQGYSKSNLRQLIPISKISNFNDEITIEAGYRLDGDDKLRIQEFLADRHDFEVTRQIDDEFSVSVSYKFENSIIVDDDPAAAYSLEVWGKTKRAKKEREVEGYAWTELVRFVKTMMPNVLFFPNFLFEFPDRIYLENPPEEAEKHEYYREVFQDVLHAIDKKASLETHIISRIKGDGSWSV